MTAANLLTQWSRLLLTSLADAGVRDVVLSPGSRSTPFVIAADREPRFRCHDSMDERAAAFFALGQARVTSRPSLLLCTSGTAAAHYYPAVIEASLAHLPLLILTADRPLELQDCGAAQTIDQQKLYGGYVRRFYEMGTPDPAPSALAGVRRLAAQSFHFSCSPVAGPVHLNVRARKPLEPAAGSTDEERAVGDQVDALLARPQARAHRPVPHPDRDAVEAVAARCRTAERGLIVAGPAPLAHVDLRNAVGTLARVTRYPLLAETTSQLRLAGPVDDIVRCDAFDAVLRSPAFRRRHRPDLVIQIGGGLVSSGWEQYSAAHGDVERIVIAEHAWPDADGAASDLLLGGPLLSLEAIVAELLRAAPRRGAASDHWNALFVDADDVAWAAVDAELAGAKPDVLTEGGAVRTVAARVPPGSLLMLGNSLPVREADMFCRPGTTDAGVLCQRGANGIDGLVAGAAGSASTQHRPATLLLGDVSLLHDLSGLGLAGRAEVPLVVVVLQNHGGRIFEQLPLATTPDLPDRVMDHVVTPHTVSFEHAALLYGLRYAVTTSVEELEKSLDRAYHEVGCTLIEAIVPVHGAVAQHQRIFRAVEAGLEL